MAGRIVVVVGVGNLRCGPPVVGALAVWRPMVRAEVRLYDANEESLDLFDRFARACLDRAETGHGLRSTSLLDEALEGASDVVVAIGEDCARRMTPPTGSDPQTQESPSREPPAELATTRERSFLDLVRGDPNRPTPIERLGPQTRLMLAPRPADARSRAEAIAQAVAAVVPAIPPRARVLSLVRSVPLPEGREHDFLAWPKPLDDEQTLRVPHQILRWILGEHTLNDLLAEALRSPVVRWLEGGR